MGRLITRRRILSSSLLTLPMLAAPGLVGVAAKGQACDVTAEQSEGPFYPTVPIESRSNLIPAASSQIQPAGVPIVVRGRLTDARCRPLANGEVQLWQADARGRYNHPGDRGGGGIESGFLYWGKTSTDKAGNYCFVTILPAAYPAGGSWMRPPHIHFKFSAGGDRQLTTQMYFPGQPLNDRDFLLQGVSAARRRALIASPVSAEGQGPQSMAEYRFDVVI